MPPSLIAEINDAKLARSAVLAGEAFGTDYDERGEERALTMVRQGASLIRIGIAVALGVCVFVALVLSI